MSPMKKKPYQPTQKKTLPKNKPSTGRQPQSMVTFSYILKPLIPEPVKPVAKTTLQSAPLAHLNYSDELKFKDKALDLFWKQHALPGSPEPVIGSPKPRQYRTTTKRRTVFKGSRLLLLSGDRTPQKKPFVQSPLEPREHSQIYSFLQKKLSDPAFKLVAEHLNYLIIRGSYAEQAVIFNVDMMNGPLVRKLKIVGDHLQKLEKTITSAYIYLDPTGSDYYLEERQPANLLNFKKLFGM